MTLLAVEPILPGASKRRIPQTHLPSLMILFWPVELILFRSIYISKHISHRDQRFILEAVLTAIYSLWALVYLNLGFRTRLDGVLKGMKAGRGNAAGTKAIIGKGTGDEEEYTVVDNPAEPRCMYTCNQGLAPRRANVDRSAIVSRALFSHVIPIVLRHYYKPFQLKDTPAIREDDTPAVSLANWRLAYGNPTLEEATSNGHLGSKKQSQLKPKKETKLAIKLLWHFRRLYALQAVGHLPARPKSLLITSRYLSSSGLYGPYSSPSSRLWACKSFSSLSPIENPRIRIQKVEHPPMSPSFMWL